MNAPLKANPQTARSDGGAQGPDRNAVTPEMIQSIREARDAVLAKNRELIDMLAKAEDEIATLGFERDDAVKSRDAALNTATEFARDNEALRAQIENAGNGQGQDSEQARKEFQEIVAAISAERDRIRHELAERTAENAELYKRLAEAGPVAQEAAQLAADLAEARRRLGEANEGFENLAEEQKKKIAGLVEQLAAAQKSWTVEVQKREAIEKQHSEQKRVFESVIQKLKTENPAGAAQPAEAVPGPEQPQPAPPAEAAEPGDQISDEQVHEAVTAMFGCIAAVKERPEAQEPIAELRARFGEFATQTASGARRTMHGVATAAKDFAAYLERTPAKIAPGVPLLEKTVETLGWLLLRGGPEAQDLTGSLVYAVDDDMDNCECIAAALEKVALQTKYTSTPEAAIDQIATSQCKLIILDVDMPRMDGFEVHSRVRKMPGHDKTPIIFLSGHMSTAYRIGSLQPDNSHFVPKPYTLSELSLRALMMIAEASLG